MKHLLTFDNSDLRSIVGAYMRTAYPELCKDKTISIAVKGSANNDVEIVVTFSEMQSTRD